MVVMVYIHQLSMAELPLDDPVSLDLEYPRLNL